MDPSSPDSSDTEGWTHVSESEMEADPEEPHYMDDYDEGGTGVDWTRIIMKPYLKQKAEKGPDPEDFDIPCIRRGENEEPFLTPKEEERLIRKQVEDSKGFDIDFKKFRSAFNYRPVDFEVDDTRILFGPLTTKELMDKLSRQSLAKYNDKKETNYEFVKVLYANYNTDMATGIMYFITFQGKAPSDDKPKQFQAKVCNFLYKPDKCVTCKLKPDKKRGHSNEEYEEDEDAKRRRLMQEGGTSPSLAP